MKHYILVYDTCTFFEVVLWGYFLKASGEELAYCAEEDTEIRTFEGFIMRPDEIVREVLPAQVKSFTVPGGDIGRICREDTASLIRLLEGQKTWIGGICAGVDYLDECGVLCGRDSISTLETQDVVCDRNIVTARPNAYVDFAIEMGKALAIFADEADLKETVDFYKHFQRAWGPQETNRKGEGNHMEERELVREAFEAQKMSYSPYSGFGVGAALLAADGAVYRGCNIENAAYTPTNCAERTAFFKAVSEGVMDFTAIAIVGKKKEDTEFHYCAPCGVCRQVMVEFCDPDTFRVILAVDEEHYKTYLLRELLPLGFTGKDMK